MLSLIVCKHYSESLLIFNQPDTPMERNIVFHKSPSKSYNLSTNGVLHTSEDSEREIALSSGKRSLISQRLNEAFFVAICWK